MNVNTDRRVGGRVLPIVTLPSSGAAVKYVYMQSLAKIFWQHTDTMKISYDLVRVGLQVTVRTFMKRSLDGITEDDFAVLLATHKKYVADPLDGAKTRRISLLPLANAIKIARLREIPSTAFFLRSLGEEAPTMHEAPKQCKQQRRLDRLDQCASVHARGSARVRVGRSLDHRRAAGGSRSCEAVSRDRGAGERATYVVSAWKRRRR